MSVSVCRKNKGGGGGGAWAETDSTIEKGVMGVGEGSVCASVQNMGGGAERGVRLTSQVGLFVNS